MARFDIEERLSAAQDLAPVEQGGSGQLVRINTPAEGVIDPQTDLITGGSAVVQIGSGMEEAYSAHSIDGTLILAGDRKFMLAALRFDAAGGITSIAMTAPVPNRDSLTKADGTWSIKRVDALSPAGIAIFYTLQLRRG